MISSSKFFIWSMILTVISSGYYILFEKASFFHPEWVWNNVTGTDSTNSKIQVENSDLIYAPTRKINTEKEALIIIENPYFYSSYNRQNQLNRISTANIYLSTQSGVYFLGLDNYKKSFYNAYCKNEVCVLFFNNENKVIDLRNQTIQTLVLPKEEIPKNIIGSKILTFSNSDTLISADATEIYIKNAHTWDLLYTIPQLFRAECLEYDDRQLDFFSSNDNLIIFKACNNNTQEISINIKSKAITRDIIHPFTIIEAKQLNADNIYFIANTNRGISYIFKYLQNGDLEPIYENIESLLYNINITKNKILFNKGTNDTAQTIIIDKATGQIMRRKLINLSEQNVLDETQDRILKIDNLLNRKSPSFAQPISYQYSTLD